MFLKITLFILKSIHESISLEPNKFSSIIEKYAFQLTHTPVAPISSNRFGLTLVKRIISLTILFFYIHFKIIKEFELPFKSVLIHPQDEYGFEVFNLDLSIIFMKFSLDNVIKVILVILTECKIIFMSKNYGLLTPFVQVRFKATLLV